jgi:hypothetical protein
MAQDIVAKIQAAAQASGVDPDVALRIAGVESSFRPAAKNTESTAAGLFQVTGPTWKQYGGKPGKQRDVDENIRVGMKILSSNKASMQEFLGREPLPSDIYAAHFFGPTGARAVMSADPLTPVASVVSKQVMEANPQLAGKTVNEVLTGYRQKFDKGGKRYPTSEPVKTTTVGQGTRTMDQEAGAAAPALSARDRIAGMGSNYQAALAAMMLGEASDEDDKDDDTDTPKEEAYKAPAAANALSELDLGRTASPFDAMEPAVQPEGAKYPMRFAGGGFVPKAAYSPTEKRELEDFNNQWQGYQDQYDIWRKEQYDPYQAAYEKYQTEVYNPYQTAYKAYESDYDKYVQAIGAWNEGPRTSPYAGPAQPTAPTQLTEFTMPAPTGSPIPPGLTQEAYAGMDQAALDKYAQEQSAAASARATQASADQRNRQSALNVAFNPEQFNLSLPDRIASRFMAEGGEASTDDYPGIMDVRNYATQASERMFPTEAGEDDRQDAARHMLAAALASKAVGPTAADLLGKAHERFSNAESFFNMFGLGKPRYDYDMDVQNNRIGISLADQATSREELEALVKQMAEQASIHRNPNLPWAMDQEQRDALIEDRKRRLETPQYKNAGGEMVADETFSKDFEGYKALDPRAVEEAIYRSRNLTKKTDPDSWPSPGNPRRSIPNEPRDYPTRAGQELLEFLQQADRMPTVVEPRRYPGGSYDAPGFTYRSNNPEDRGVVEVPTFTKDGYGTLVHELTHAADRAMEVEQLRLYRKVRAGEPLTLGEQRFYDGYSKLYDTKTNLPLDISDESITDSNRRYRTSPKELRAFGTGNMAQDQPEPGRYSLEDIGATLNPHVDPTMAQDAAIMRDLYLRRGEVRGRAEGSPPEGEYADPEAAFMAGAGDVPAPNAENAAAALAAIRGLGEYPYNLVGGGVDLATMAMRPFGYDVEKPVMGSDWIKEKATQLGIRPPEETDPTLRDIRMGTEIATSVLDPFAGARAVAQGVQKTGQAARMLEDMTIGNMQRAKIRGAAEQVPDDAAYAPLRERMEAQGNLAMAVKPVGGYFVAGDGTGTFANEMDMFVKLGIGDSEIPAVQSFVDKQMKDYLSKTMGSPKDPLRQAIDEGRVPYLRRTDDEGAGIDNFKDPSMAALRAKRKYQGFPEEGYAQTEEGEKFENYIDWMIDPYAPSTMEITELPPALRKKAEAAIKERGIENVDYTDSLGNIFGSDYAAPGAKTSEALGLGATESLYSFFDKYRVLNLQATKGMLEKMLTDTTLPDTYRLTPDQLTQMSLADASVAAKKLDNYLIKLADKQRLNRINEMPTTKIYETGERWLAPDDLAVEHDQRALVRVLGEKAGWCTKDNDSINMYGSAENRLNILVDKTGRPQVQVTTTVPEDVDAVSWFHTLDQESYDAKEAIIKRYFQNNNLPVPTSQLGHPAIRTIDNTIGLNRIFANDPQYQAFVRNNSQPVAFEIERATKEQGAIKTALTDEAFNKTLDLVRTRGARFDSSNDAVRKLSALDEYGGRGEPLLRDIGGQIDPSVTNAAESLFKDTVLSAPELVQVLRDPQVRQSLPLNILNKSDDLFNKFADAPPEAFKYAMNTRDYYDPDFAERVIPVIDAKKYKRWKNSMDPLYQSAMREYQLMREGWGSPPDNFAKGGLVERNVYNHQKYL